MATIKQESINYLTYEGRVFLPSENINVFPCSRRGQVNTDDSVTYFDPEARLNTERTNRISSSVNGFTDSFIVTDSFNTEGTLVFVLAGYYVEIKNFSPAEIADVLGSNPRKIYAHLGLHKEVSLQVKRSDDEYYTTEILYRQATGQEEANYLDVSHTSDGISDEFFVGISFAASELVYNNSPILISEKNLLLFNKSESGDNWTLEQTSLLPHIEHGETLESIKVNGVLTVNASATIANNLTVGTDNNTNTGTITAKKLVTAPTLQATTSLNVAGNTTISGATTVDNTITAKKLTIPSDKDENGRERGEVDTPQLRVDRITSSNTANTITIDNKKLVVNRSLEMRAPAPTIDVPDPTPAKATIEQAVIGDLVVKQDTELKGSTGSITADVINSNDIKQKVDSAYYTVPVIFVQPQKSRTSGETSYQLQISRANILAEQQVD